MWPFRDAREAAAALAISDDGDRAVAVTSQHRLYVLSGLSSSPPLAAATEPLVLALDRNASYDGVLSGVCPATARRCWSPVVAAPNS